MISEEPLIQISGYCDRRAYEKICNDAASINSGRLSK